MKRFSYSVCVHVLVHSELFNFGKSSYFPFPYFVLFVLRCFPFLVVCSPILLTLQFVKSSFENFPPF